MKCRSSHGALLLAGLGVLLACVAHAETKTWSPASDGAWSDVMHWSPPGLPGGGDTVVFPASAQSYTVLLDVNPPTLSSLDFANPLGTFRLSNAALGTSGGATFAGTLSVGGSAYCGGVLHTPAGTTTSILPGAVFTLGGPTWTNEGLATIAAPATALVTYVRPNGHTTLAGTGTLRLLDADHAIVDSPGGWEFTQAAAHTLAGAGYVPAPLHNHGTIVADVPGATLTLATLRDNDGTLRATNGGLLRLTSCSVTNGGGAIRAEGGDVELLNTLVAGGTLSRTGTSVVRFAGNSALSDVTHTGFARIPPTAVVTLLGSTFTNPGTVELGSAGATAHSYLRPSSHVTISGAGDLRLMDAGYAIFDSPGGWVITQAAEHTTHGAGLLATPFVNHGAVAADVAGATLTVTGNKWNTGTFRSTGGALLSISSTTLENTGGQLLAAGGDVELQNSIVGGGTISASAGSLVHLRASVQWSDVAAAGTQRLHAGGALTLAGSTITNSGRLEVGEPGMTQATYVRPGSHLQLAGPGTFALIEEGASVFDSPGGWVVTQAAGHTVRGAGLLTTPLVNHGLVSADVPGRTLVVQSAFTNDGTLRATAGGRLRLQNMTLANENGHLVAAGGDVELSNINVHGGVIERTGGSTFHLRDAVGLWDLAHSAEMRVHGATSVNLLGSGIRNDGTIVLSGPGETAVTWLRPGSHMVLSGGGSLVLDRHDLAMFDSPGGWTVTQGPDHTIRGTGWISAPLTNHGLLSADVAGATLEVTGPSTHDGACQAAYGGVLRFGAWPANLSGGTLTGGTWRAYSNSGIRFPGASITTNAATIVLDGEHSRLESDDQGRSALALLATNEPAASLVLRNGRHFLTVMPFTNRGTLRVGDKSLFSVESPGIADAGPTDFTQEATGRLVIEIAGTAPGRCGSVDVHGHVRLAGTLQVAILDGFTPTPGDSFPVMSFDSREGGFTAYEDMNVAPGVWLSPVWQAGRLVLVARSQPGVDAPRPAAPTTLAFAAVGPASARGLQLALPADADVTVELFDVSGRRLATLMTGRLGGGVHRWDVPAAAGLRLARARVRTGGGERVLSAKLVQWR